MSNIYIVIQRANYRHAIVGAFPTLDEAKPVADSHAAAEDHHDFEVIEVAIGVSSSLVKGWNSRGYPNADTWPVVYTAEHAVNGGAIKKPGARPG